MRSPDRLPEALPRSFSPSSGVTLTKKSSGCLWIAEDITQEFLRVPKVHLMLNERTVSACSRRNEPHLCQIRSLPFESATATYGFPVSHRCPQPFSTLCPARPNPVTSVQLCTSNCSITRLAVLFKEVITRITSSFASAGSHISLHRRIHDAGSQRLRQNQYVSRSCTAVFKILSG